MNPSAEVTVWLVEDDDLFRMTISDLIEESPGIRCPRAFTNGEDALVALRDDDAPEVMLMDIGLPGMDGLQCSQKAKGLSPATQIIMLTMHEDENSIFRAMCAGASGYMLKSASADEILNAVHEVQAGGVPFTAPVARKVLTLFSTFSPEPGEYDLTKREKQVLTLMADGFAQKEIAEELFLSPHTIETHTRNIYAKLHVKSGTAAVAKAIKARLI